MASLEPTYTVRVEREVDGRFLAYVDELPGVMKYGASEEQAGRGVVALALAVIADQIEHGEAGFMRGAEGAVPPANFRFVPAELLAGQQGQ